MPEQEDDWHLMSFYDEFVASNGDLLTRQASAPCPPQPAPQPLRNTSNQFNVRRSNLP